MSGIDIPISISENVVNPFHEMSRAISDTVNQFRSLQNEMGRTIQPNFNASQFRAPIEDIGNGTRRNIQLQNEYNQAVEIGGGSMGRLATRIRGMAGAYIGLQALKGLVNLSDEFSQSTVRLDMVNDGLRTTKDLTAQIYQIAQDTRSSFSDVNAVVSKLGLLASDAFSGNDELLKFNELMLKSFKISGASGQEQSAAMYQLTQAMASGRLQGDEFRSIRENAPMLAQAIQKELNGVDMKKASADGLITNDVIKRALFRQADEIEQRFAKMPYTFSDVVTKIKNNFIAGMSPMLKAINSLWNNKYIKSFVDNSIVAFYLLGQVGAGAINVINWAITLVGNNWSWLGPIVYSVVAGLLVYKGVMIGIALWHGIVAGATTVAGFASEFYAVATGQATVAQYSFNAALMANPLTWILVVVVAVIALYFALVGAYNQVTGAHVSGVGLICAAFAYMGAVVINVFAYMYNVVAIVAEFVANVFKHPTYSVIRLFVNLTSNVLKTLSAMTEGIDGVATSIANAFVWAANHAIRAINWIIGALNKIPGVNIGTVGEIGQVKSFSGSLKNKALSMEKWADSFKPKDYWTAPKANFASSSEWASKGYDFGKGLGDKVKNMFKFGDDKNKNKNNYKDFIKDGALAPGGKDGNKHLRDTAKNTERTADNTEAAIDDIKFLREMSERNAINRFTTAEININVTNNNSVASDYDLDGLVDNMANSLGDKVMERLDISTDGHYNMA